MPITDLTGTKWLINENSLQLTNMDTSINFISNNQTFNRFETRVFGVIKEIYYYAPGETLVYDSEGVWTNEAYRTIEITGGTDATNTDLINWLQANATQIIEPQPTDTNKISVGTLKLAKAFIGNSEVASMWLGNVKIYEKASSYDYNYSNGTLTINNAPYNYNNGVLTIE